MSNTAVNVPQFLASHAALFWLFADISRSDFICIPPNPAAAGYFKKVKSGASVKITLEIRCLACRSSEIHNGCKIAMWRGSSRCAEGMQWHESKNAKQMKSILFYSLLPLDMVLCT